MSGGLAEPADYNMLPSAAQAQDWNGPTGTYGFCKALIEVSSIAPWASTLIVAGIAIIIAWIVNAERTPNNPSHKSFLWGYFIVFSGGLDGMWIFLSHLRLAACLQPSLNLLVATYGAVLVFFSYAAYKRSKIGWIGASVLSLNPIWWVINYFYARKRWDEFDSAIPFPKAFAFWLPLQAWLKFKRFKEQHKLLHQNYKATTFLSAYFSGENYEEKEVVKLCEEIGKRANGLGKKAYSVALLPVEDLEVLIKDNRDMRRLYDSTATSRIRSFDKAFRPILGWERYYKDKAEMHRDTINEAS
jgi:hypothetical protein